MVDISSIIITNILGFLAWFYGRLTACDPLEVIIAIILGYLAWSYDRGRRYNYLADRWNTLMNMNQDMPDFFDSKKTKEYKTFDNVETCTKYHQYARMCWGFVEDVIRNDYSWERLGCEKYIEAYEDTIRNFISCHHAWLRDNTHYFETYSKFSKILIKKFGNQIRKEDYKLYEWLLR